MSVSNLTAVLHFQEAVEKDVKFIQCQACHAVVKRAVFRTNQMRKEREGKSDLSENSISDLVENICDTNHGEGKWIMEYDMVEQYDKPEQIKLKRQNTAGECLEECKTIELACRNIQDEAEAELVTLLWKNKLDKAKLLERICMKKTKKLAGSCKKGAPKVPDNRKPLGDNFKPLNAPKASTPSSEAPKADAPKSEL